MSPSVFIVDLEEANAGWEAKEGIVPDWAPLYAVNKTN